MDFKRKRRHGVQIEPSHVRGIVAGRGSSCPFMNKIRQENHMTVNSGDTVIYTENAELPGVKTRFLQEFPPGAILRRFPPLEESSGEAPFSRMRLDIPKCQEDAEIPDHHQTSRGKGIDINYVAAPGTDRAMPSLPLHHPDRSTAKGTKIIFRKFQFHKNNIKPKGKRKKPKHTSLFFNQRPGVFS
jgi:hypothetical protein